MHVTEQLNLGAAAIATGATNATATVTVDTKGADEAAIIVGIPPATATNSSYTLSAFLVKAGDTTAVTSATTIVTGGTDFTVPVNNNTSSPATAKVVVGGPLLKRYLFVQTTPSAAIAPSVFVLLARTGENPKSSNHGFNAAYTDNG
jgi:hypothetical protein